MNTLIMTLLLWLSVNFGLPTTNELPRVEFVSNDKLVKLRYSTLGGTGPIPEAGPRQPVGLYLHTTQTIYLRDDWTGSTAAEVSILVHELVHHLQHLGKLKFECPQEREQIAYQAQEKWLSLFGRDLLHEFEIDGFTLLVSSRCLH